MPQGLKFGRLQRPEAQVYVRMRPLISCNPLGWRLLSTLG